MSQQEICQIVHKHRDVSMSKIANWWEARQATPQGEIILAKSAEFSPPWHERGSLYSVVSSLGFGDRNDWNILDERERAANSQVVAQLLAEGWETAGVNDKGLITLMKRTSINR